MLQGRHFPSRISLCLSVKILNNIVSHNVEQCCSHHIVASCFQKLMTAHSALPVRIMFCYCECSFIKVNSILLKYLPGTIFAYGQTGTGKTFTMEGQ